MRDTLFTAYGKVQRALRDDRWKLIRYPRINRTQFFDLQKDPHEIEDLADKPEYAGRIRDMMVLLGNAQREYDDDCPLTSAHPDDPSWSPERRKAP